MTFTAPSCTLTSRNGRPTWLFADGTTLPVISGGAVEVDDTPKAFTQADVDRIVQERLARVKPETPADYDELKKAAERLATLEAKNATDLEQAQARATALEAERDAAKADVEKARADAASMRIRSAVVAEAAKAKAVNPDQVFALLPKDAVTLGDDGQVTGAESAVKAFVEANPHFVGSPQRPRPDDAQGARDADTKPSVAAGRDLFEARKSGTKTS